MNPASSQRMLNRTDYSAEWSHVKMHRLRAQNTDARRLRRTQHKGDQLLARRQLFLVFVFERDFDLGAVRQHFAVGLHLPQSIVNHAGDMVRCFKRCTGRQKNIDLQAPLIERRQEVSTQLCDRQHANGDRGADAEKNGPRMFYAESNRETRDVL